MTAREVRAAFEKNRIREGDIEGMMLLLFWSIPQAIEEHPEWLGTLFTPKTICDFQMMVIKRAVKDQTMLRLIFDNSDRLRTMFGDAVRAGSLFKASSITLAAQQKIETLLSGKVLPELDQWAAANRDLSVEEQNKCLELASKPWIANRFKAGTLSFRMVLEREPRLLLVRWSLTKP
ncbi:MAG TPA: hypothetical protein VJ841_03745 [Candidatus Saccharimonadales bacterium]|nr:hypothetical protein [Candidatus Saccharimonadales bacterium]